MPLRNSMRSTDPLDLLRQSYQGAELLYKSVSTPTTFALARTCELATELTDSLYTLSHQAPQLLFSQLSLTPQDHSTLAQLAVKQAALLTLLRRKLPLPESAQRHILCALLIQPLALVSPETLTPVQQRYPALLSVQRYPELCQQLALSTTLSQCYHKVRSKPLWRTHQSALLVSFCWQVARLLLPQAGKSVGLEHIAKQCLSKADAAELFLWQCISAEPRWQLGRFLKTASQQLAMLLALKTEGTCSAILFDKQTKRFTEPMDFQTHELQLLDPRRFADWSFCHYWQTSPPEPKNSHPSLEWLEQLQRLPSVSQQSAALESEPGLANLLIKHAEQLNRQKRAPSSTLHAIALIGQENLPSVLKHCWLQSQCQQQSHPWHTLFLQIKSALCQSLLLLNHEVKALELSSSGAETLAWCCTWPLWQQQEARQSALATAQQESLFEHFLTQQFWHQAQYPKLLSKVLQHLNCPNEWLFAATHFRAPAGQALPPQKAQLLACALKLATSLYALNPSSQTKLLESLKMLHPSLPHKLKSMQDQLLTHCAPYSPLLPFCN